MREQHRCLTDKQGETTCPTSSRAYLHVSGHVLLTFMRCNALCDLTKNQLIHLLLPAKHINRFGNSQARPGAPQQVRLPFQQNYSAFHNSWWVKIPSITKESRWVSFSLVLGFYYKQSVHSYVFLCWMCSEILGLCNAARIHTCPNPINTTKGITLSSPHLPPLWRTVWHLRRPPQPSGGAPFMKRCGWCLLSGVSHCELWLNTKYVQERHLLTPRSSPGPPPRTLCQN